MKLLAFTLLAAAATAVSAQVGMISTLPLVITPEQMERIRSQIQEDVMASEITSSAVKVVENLESDIPIELAADMPAPSKVNVVDAPIELAADVPAPSKVNVVDAPIELAAEMPAPSKVNVVESPIELAADVPAPSQANIVDAPIELAVEVPAPTKVIVVDAPIEATAEVSAPTKVNIVESPEESEPIKIQQPVIIDNIPEPVHIRRPNKLYNNPLLREH